MSQPIEETPTIKGKNENAVSYEELKSIERGLNDFQLGRTVSHTQLKKRYEKLLY